jgi:hypothetical protein
MTTLRAARRTAAAVLGLAAAAAFLLPGRTASSTPIVATPQPAGTSVEQVVADPGPPSPQSAIGRTSVAFGGGVHLAAYVTTDRVVEVTRVSAAGEVLDPLGIEVADWIDGYSFFDPVVAFDGTNFLVVWLNEQLIAAKRVSPGGEVLDAANIVVSTRPPLAEQPAIAFDGDNYLVTWVSPSTPGGTSGDIFGRRVSPQGVVVDPADLTISSDPADQHDVSLAFNGAQYLLVWDHNRLSGSADIHGTLVDRTGVPQNPAGEPLTDDTSEQREPAVASIGASFFVVWTGGGGGERIHGTRVSAAGAVLDPAGIAISTDVEAQGRAAAVSNGTTVLVTWVQDPYSSGGRRARYARVDASGVVLDPTVGRPLPAVWDEVGAASDGAGYLVAGKGVAVRLAPSGDVIDPGRIVFPGAGNEHAEPDSAFDGTNTLVVWSDDRFGDQRIYGSRVGPDGQGLDGPGISISAPTDLFDSPLLDQASPAVAFDGTNYLVVWVESRRFQWPFSPQPILNGARVSPSGEVLGRLTLDLTGGGQKLNPEIAFGDGVFLVAWENTYQGLEAHVATIRVSPAGEVLDATPRPALNEENEYGYHGLAKFPAVAHGPSGFVVVWQEQRYLGATLDVYGTRVSADGTVTRPVTAISAAPGDQARPDIAWHDGHHLVVWQDGRNAAAGEIYGARLDGDGAVLDPSGFLVSHDPAGEGAPSVAANGVFFVAWSRERAGGRDIAGTTVTGGGVVGGSQFIAHTAAAEDEAVVAPAHSSRNFSVAYERFDAPHGADRTYLTHVSPK